VRISRPVLFIVGLGGAAVLFGISQARRIGPHMEYFQKFSYSRQRFALWRLDEVLRIGDVIPIPSPLRGWAAGAAVRTAPWGLGALSGPLPGRLSGAAVPNDHPDQEEGPGSQDQTRELVQSISPSPRVPRAVDHRQANSSGAGGRPCSPRRWAVGRRSRTRDEGEGGPAGGLPGRSWSGRVAAPGPFASGTRGKPLSCMAEDLLDEVVLGEVMAAMTFNIPGRQPPSLDIQRC